MTIYKAAIKQAIKPTYSQINDTMGLQIQASPSVLISYQNPQLFLWSILSNWNSFLTCEFCPGWLRSHPGLHFNLTSAWAMLDLLWMQALNLICLYGAEILPVFTQSQIANYLFISFVLLKNEWIAVWKPLYLNNVMYFWVKQDILWGGGV